MKKNLGFRAWFFFRTGWSTYFALIFSTVNTLVVTYYLAIERVPLLKEIFPSFINYFTLMVAIGIPILVIVGYVHYKKSAAYGSEMDIGTEANPYYYKLPPGYWKDVIIPFYHIMSKIMVETSKEKLTSDDLKKMTDLQKKMDILIQGGYVGDPKRKMFENKNESKE